MTLWSTAWESPTAFSISLLCRHLLFCPFAPAVAPSRRSSGRVDTFVSTFLGLSVPLFKRTRATVGIPTAKTFHGRVRHVISEYPLSTHTHKTSRYEKESGERGKGGVRRGGSQGEAAIEATSAGPSLAKHARGALDDAQPGA